MCFCWVGPKRGALIVLHASVLIAVYSLVREIAQLCLIDNKTIGWTTVLSICAPIIDLVMIVFAVRGISLKNENFLVPILSSKFIYFFQTCIILAIIPVSCYIYGFEKAVEEFRRRFIAMGSSLNSDIEPMPFYWELILMTFKSLLIFPMEEILYSSNQTVAIVYIIYLVIVAVFQAYFVVALAYCYNSLKIKPKDELPKRFCIARRQTNESTEYLLVPEGSTLPRHSVTGSPYKLVDDETYDEIMSTSEKIPVSIN